MFRCHAVALFWATTVLATTACSNGLGWPAALEASSASRALPETDAGRHSRSGRLEHIVIVTLEARSFDDLFCGHSSSQGKCGDETIPLEANCRLSDTFGDYERDRRTGDFGKERADCPGYQAPEYAHVPASEVAEYYAIAQQYVLGDATFSSTGNPTFESHQYLIAAEAGNAKNEPFGKASDGCVYHQWVREFGGDKTKACFTYQTLAGLLSAAGLTWSYYRTADRKHPVVNAWDAYGWVDGGSTGTSPSSKFISDVCSGKLASVTWVTPAYADSDLSGSLSATGPKWVASVVNAVGESQYWGSTAVVITWSGFGGWYDHVPPPTLDRTGLGFRVPLLVVSPYARSGYVDHVQLETGSILRFVEDTFGLRQLATSDKRARDLGASALDLRQKPRAFVPIAGGSGCSRR